MFTILDWKDESTNTPDISLGLRRAGTWTRLPCPGSQPGQDVNSLYLGYKIPASRPPISAQGSPQPNYDSSYVAPTGASSPGELEEATQAETTEVTETVEAIETIKYYRNYKIKIKSSHNQHKSDERRKSGEFGERRE